MGLMELETERLKAELEVLVVEVSKVVAGADLPDKSPGMLVERTVGLASRALTMDMITEACAG